MTQDFTGMLAMLKQQATLITDLQDFVHVGSGETLIHRIHKYFEANFQAGVSIFVDTSEAFLDDDDSDNVRVIFELGITSLTKAKLHDATAIDIAWNDTMSLLVKYLGRLKCESQEEDEFEIIVHNKFAQVGKIVNTDVYGWRADVKITISVNETYRS